MHPATANVVANGSATLTNATVKVLNTPYNDDGINVVTRSRDNITISSSTITGQSRDLLSVVKDGTLQFDIKVNALNNKGSNVHLAMTSDSLSASPTSTVHEAGVRISSAIHASTGADTQTLSIPLSCFTNQGIDFSTSLTQFAITNSADINYHLSNIQLISNSSDERTDLSCTPAGHVLMQNDTVVFSAFRTEPGVDGWATVGDVWGPATIGHPDK
ncbi:putative glycoside hydrolase [Endozoicomonas lisbonensis]|uniref:ExoP galactose-binding-like domain-containing protein n=1 Tax=Endozoicomonas lisbonensis TaxID=3120522 RepID=A0ABV2SL42_9GAMM